MGLMNKLDLDYQNLLKDILENGVKKETRNGGTTSVFGRQIRHKMSDGFPLLTTKKMAWKTMVTELLWFLRGDTNIKFLVDNNCHIWDGDAYKRYCTEWSKYPSEGVFSSNEYSSPTEYEAVRFTQEEFINKIKTDDEFAKTWGELGPVYGKQWRSWHSNAKVTMDGKYHEEKGIDQIQNLINDLKTNPDSRRLMVNAWNVGELDQMVLPPCHYLFQVYTRELKILERTNIAIENKLTHETAHLTKDFDYRKWFDENNVPTRAISLMFNMRSNDVPLGLPFNLASYGLLLEILAKQVNMIPDELIANLGDVHIYKNQIDGVKEQLKRTPMKLPNLIISEEVNFNGTIDEFLESCNKDSFKLDGYESHPPIKIPLSN
jgi:thymidylate synthase